MFDVNWINTIFKVCQNNATINDEYGTCMCPPLWTNVDCSSPICLNGGTNDANAVCNCAPGYYGSNCQNGQLFNK
jgi:hypothetical protein